MAALPHSFLPGYFTQGMCLHLCEGKEVQAQQHSCCHLRRCDSPSLQGSPDYHVQCRQGWDCCGLAALQGKAAQIQEAAYDGKQKRRHAFLIVVHSSVHDEGGMSCQEAENPK